MVITDTPSQPFYKIAIDAVSPLPKTTKGNVFVLTMQCLFCKFCIAVPVVNIKAKTVAVAIAENLIAIHGVPKIILSDQGKSFRNKLLKSLSKIFNFDLKTTTAYHPQSNASLERSHAVLKAYLRTNAAHSDWDHLVPFAIMEYNSSPHRSTGFTPYEIAMGRNRRTPSSCIDEFEIDTYNGYAFDLATRLAEIRETALNALKNSKEKNKIYYDRKAKELNIKIGDKVYVNKLPRKNKMDKFYNGIFKVIELVNNHTARVQSENGKSLLVHKDRLKKFY